MIKRGDIPVEVSRSGLPCLVCERMSEEWKSILMLVIRNKGESCSN